MLKNQFNEFSVLKKSTPFFHKKWMIYSFIFKPLIHQDHKWGPYLALTFFGLLQKLKTSLKGSNLSPQWKFSRWHGDLSQHASNNPLWRRYWKTWTTDMTKMSWSPQWLCHVSVLIVILLYTLVIILNLSEVEKKSNSCIYVPWQSIR